MSISQSLLPEFDQEMANTRKTLERVPDDKLGWKPHPKSFAMGALAQHLATMVGWTVDTIGKDFTGSQNYLLTANSFDYNYQRVPGTPRDGQRLPSEFDQSISVQYLLSMGLAIRVDIFNVWNETLVSGFVNNVPGGGPRTEILGSPIPANSGIHRAFQFGATYSF